MLLAFDSVADGAVLTADVCIIGTGAAGLTMAREFAGTSTSVILVESGGLRVMDEYEALNDGDVAGAAFYGLRSGRRRGLGGTTAAWGGQCCELDAEDFIPRTWLSNGGWPITKGELLPFYRRAERVFGVQKERYDETNWKRFGITPIRYDRGRLQTSFSVFSPRPRLGRVYRKLLERSKNVRVYWGATATNIRTEHEGQRATSIDVRNLTGKRAEVRARAFVLCTGTIEAARLLLASRDALPGGLGNQHDLVGRYFQDHPTADTATITSPDVRKLQELYGVLYRGKTWYWPKIALAPAEQLRTKSLNACAAIMFEYDSSAMEVLRNMVRTTRTGGALRFSRADIAALLRGTPTVIEAGFRRYIRGRSPLAKPAKIDLTCTIEQVPNPDSRVTLSENRDSFGQQRARVDWKITDVERHTFRVMTETVDAELRRLGLGSVHAHPWLATNDPSAWSVWDNFHQTGTTRMADSPTRGVVDRNCEVFGTRGLYVAGAPVFPTSGYANPVLTIAALTIRLSDHLKETLRDER